MARAHRIGQTRAVSVYRLLTAKTYEMHMFHSASMKLGLDRAVLAHQRQQNDDEEYNISSKKKKSKLEKESQAKEIDQLLKKGAYDVFRDDDDSEAKKFMETDIDELLKRSSRTVTYGDTQNSLSSGLGSFSKASFVSSDVDGKDVDLDDPEFWSKAVGFDAPTEGIDENVLLYGEKRNRKQVQVFDPFATFQEAEQKKKDKLALKQKEEKEKKKRLKEERRQKKNAEKERKRKEKEETKLTFNSSASHVLSKEMTFTKEKKKDIENGFKERKIEKDSWTKKIRRLEQRKLLRSMEQEDPILDRLRQGWEYSQRDRVINAAQIYGFDRMCKIRKEATLTSLPIQDIETFLRSCK